MNLKTSYSLIAILAALLPGIAVAGGPKDTAGPERAISPHERRASVDLQVVDGKVSGRFDERPLRELVDAILGHASVEYRGDKTLLAHRVSGTFDATPRMDAVKRILEPFDHVMVLSPRGEVQRLHLMGLKRESAGDVAADLSHPPASSSAVGPGEPPARSGRLIGKRYKYRSLTESSALRLRAPEGQATVRHVSRDVPAEGIKSEVTVSETGPVDPNATVKTLPEFLPTLSPTGPTGPRTTPLPAFTPVTSPTGPVAPDAAAKPLPDFEPIISETGPP